MFRTALALLSAALLFSGCTQGDNDNSKTKTPATAEITTLKSTLSRETPETNSTDIETLRNGVSDFAFDLYAQLNETGENLFFSPYSISSAFTMLYAGAAGETRNQVRDVLHFLDDDTTHHQSFNAMDASVFNGEGNLTSANSLWLQKYFSIHSTFLDTLALHYGADLKSVDFAADPEAVRLAINAWVADHTNNLITDALGQGSIDTLTRLVLVNTIHFLENWKDTFETSDTTKDSFYLRDGSSVTIDMMHQSENHLYYRGSNFAALSKPYDDLNHKMVIILPDSGAFDTVETNLSRQNLIESISAMDYKEVNLSMPKFEIEMDYSLVNYLAAMGLTDAFSTKADFSAITAEPLMVSNVIHKAVVKVDEEGTEAAAVTAIIFETTSMPEERERVTMTINRPFFFFIMDENDTILFMGKVENPTA